LFNQKIGSLSVKIYRQISKNKKIMPRSVNHVASRARRKKIIKLAKGFYGRGKNVWTVAKNKIEKGLQYAYRDRKVKKRDFRSLWIQRINAAARQEGMSYSVFMGKIHAKGIELNRKVLADLAMNNPEAFKAVTASIK
jgi:large subunit ribosomal protein L20